MKLTEIAKKLLTKARGVRYGKLSFAQCGEDVIAAHLLQELKCDVVKYLDLGAHHPKLLSNTYYFYRHGGSGVCVEADPVLHQAIARVRPRDVCLNIGVSAVDEPNGAADFYVMTAPTLNTFSKEEAERLERETRYRIVRKMRIPVLSINQIIEQHCASVPDFVSLDVEGLDYAVLQSLDFTRWRPKVFCIETLTFTESKTERKLTEVIELMNSKNYLLYADTYINSIFVERTAWENRT